MDLKLIKSRLNFNPLARKTKKMKNGIALLMAVSTLLIMVLIASEVTKDSTIEYVVNSQEINRIRAFYIARSSLDIALLRIKVYQQAAKLNLPPSFANQINIIWNFPFVWPLPIGATSTLDVKDKLETVSKESIFDGNYSHTISDEGSRVDINDLASPSKTLREVTKKQLLNIFENKLNSDDKFKDTYANYNFEELIGRITDWMSDKNVSANNGDKRGPFQSLGEGYPPNRGFRTVDEMRLVPGMTEEFFKLMSPSITIYGSKAINPNTATELVLKSLDTGLTAESVKDAIERRDDPEKGGPFKGASSDECRADFKGFVESHGARLNPDFDQIPFQCDSVVNFKIEAIGRTGEGKGAVQKKIIAYVLNTQKAGSTIKSFLDKEKAAANPNPNGTPAAGAGPKPPPPAQEPLPKGRPRIVYWSEN